MEIRDRQLLNRTVPAGEEVVARVDLANYHPFRGRITLNLTANSSLVDQRTVAVGVDSERTVYLRVEARAPGRYEMRVNGVAVGTVTVTANTESPSATPTAGTPSDTVVPTATPTPSETEPTEAASGTGSPGRTGTTTPAVGSEDPTGIDAIVAVGMSLMLVYGVGVAVYVLREHPPSRLD